MVVVHAVVVNVDVDVDVVDIDDVDDVDDSFYSCVRHCRFCATAEGSDCPDRLTR